MSTHDPRQVVEDIRNHLAATDRRLAFLFGAGTSSGINVTPVPPVGQPVTHTPLIPGIVALTARCGEAVSALGADQSAAWIALTAQCEMNGGRSDVESILSKLRTKIAAVGEGERLIGLTREQLVETERAVCARIAREVQPADNAIPANTPHIAFASWIKRVSRSVPLEVFTTNYDLLFEKALEAAQVPVFDGFVGTHQPFFYPDCLEDDTLLPKPRWVRLWKLHGSVNWRSRNALSAGVVIRDQPTDRGELIFPSHLKYDESRKQPYMAYADRLSRVLNHDHSLLVTCGYSFSDDHINAIVYGALDNRSTANVIALVFGDLVATDGLVESALRRPNLSVIARNGGVMSGVWGTWKLTKPVDEKTHSFMDLAFDSSAAPDDAASPAASTVSLEGRMRLGDFNWLGRFLSDMGRTL